MLNIYFNKKLVDSYPRVPFLAPILWWIKNNSKVEFFDENLVSEWGKLGKQYLTFTSIEDSDFVVFPKDFAIDFMGELSAENEKAKKYWKKVIVFYHRDNEIPFNVENVIFFRTSLWKNSSFNEYCYPPIVDSIYNETLFNSKIKGISTWYVWYFDKPSVSMRIMQFIREVSTLTKIFYSSIIYWAKLIKNSLFINPERKKDTLIYLFFQRWKWKSVRYNAVKELKKSKYPFLFIKREKMGYPTIKWKTRNEYINNIYSSKFPLVTRWDWNYSYRLYEVMSAWKIPLFIDTDCKLPFENEINYKELFIWVPYEDLKHIDMYIDLYLKKHKNLKEIENEIKDIYENYLRFPQRCERIVEKLDVIK